MNCGCSGIWACRSGLIYRHVEGISDRTATAQASTCRPRHELPPTRTAFAKGRCLRRRALESSLRRLNSRVGFIGALIIGIGLWGAYYTIIVIGNSQNSLGNYLRPYIRVVVGLGFRVLLPERRLNIQTRRVRAADLRPYRRTIRKPRT